MNISVHAGNYESYHGFWPVRWHCCCCPLTITWLLQLADTLHSIKQFSRPSPSSTGALKGSRPTVFQALAQEDDSTQPSLQSSDWLTCLSAAEWPSSSTQPNKIWDVVSNSDLNLFHNGEHFTAFIFSTIQLFVVQSQERTNSPCWCISGGSRTRLIQWSEKM